MVKEKPHGHIKNEYGRGLHKSINGYQGNWGLLIHNSLSITIIGRTCKNKYQVEVIYVFVFVFFLFEISFILPYDLKDIFPGYRILV